MSRLYLAGLILSLVATGCNQYKSDQDQTASYHDANHLKPVVAIVPIIDSTQNDLPWSLSDEFTAAIDYRLSRNNNLYLVDLQKTRTNLKKTKGIQTPFGTDVNWIKKAFSDSEFVVFLELVEHEEVFRQDRKKPSDPTLCSADLNMSMRVRVFDLRGDQPRVILQELVNDTHFVPRQFTHVNFYQTPWGEQSFNISPMGLAHAEFSKELATRIEDYILLATH